MDKDRLGSVDVSESFGKNSYSEVDKDKASKDAAANNDVSSTQNQTAETTTTNDKKPIEYKKHEFKPKGQQTDKRNFILRNYDKNYKKLLLIPSLLVILSVIILLFNYSTTGEFFQKDVSISGGVTITVLQEYENIEELESFLADSLSTTVNARYLSEAGVNKGIVVEAGIESDAQVEKMLSLIEQKTGKLSSDQYSIKIIGSALGASFFRAIITSIIAAFVMMAIVVFIYFKFATGKWIIIPSLFIIWTVLVDMIGTFAVLSLLQVKVSTAGLAAFLLLIGYSVDTDILLTLRMLKSKQEKVFDRIIAAAKTGIFMTLTGMIAITVGLIITQSETIRQIMLILVIGLAFDLVHTWITNTGILRWYMERDQYGKK